MAPPPLPKSVSSNKEDESTAAGGFGTKVVRIAAQHIVFFPTCEDAYHVVTLTIALLIGSED
jgi:hypothetical protein